MKPSRPDSAKSAKTRITIDSDASSNNITQSRFSQTYSNGVKISKKQNNDFQKYVAQKDKDPKFKKYLQPRMPEIPEQARPSNDIAKLTSKPFEKKTSKNQNKKVQAKVESVKKLDQDQQNQKNIKKQNLNSSKTFIDKSKQKLKISSKQQIDQISSKNKNDQSNQTKKQQVNKAKINLNGFVLNMPGKPPQIIKQAESQPKVQETEEQKKTRERQKLFTQLSEYVQKIQQKSSSLFPQQYQGFIERSLADKNVDIQKIKIQDYLIEANEHDYDKLMRKINSNQEKLRDQNTKNMSNSSVSVDLQQIIQGSRHEKMEQDNNSDIMSSMSASDVKERNMFLTQILKGKRLTQNQLNQIKQNDQTMMKIIKLEGNNKQEQLADEQIQMAQINMNKKKNNRILQRNKIQAAGQIFRECDYLSPEEQQRIQDLINGVQIKSPFQMNEMETLINRRIDQGIQLHRQLCNSIEGNQMHQQLVIDQQTLPKDPILRKKAELNILRQKINSVNQRLKKIQEIQYNKGKIQNLIKKYKQVIRPSKTSQSLINEKNRQIQSQCQQIRQAESLLQKVDKQKQQILAIFDDLSSKFSNMESEVMKIQNMDQQQKRKLQIKQLNQKMKRVLQVQKQANQFQQEVNYYIAMNKELEKRAEALDDIMSINFPCIKCEGYQQGETIDDIDVLITKKWQAAQQAVKNIPYSQQ